MRAQPALAPMFSTANTPPATETKTKELARLASSITGHAQRSGVALEHLGQEPLFDGARLYSTGTGPWVVARGDHDPAVKSGFAIPARHRARLQALCDAGLDFPAIYIAHQVRPDQAGVPRTVGDHLDLRTDDASRLIGDIPPPPKSVALSKSLDRAARGVGNAARATALTIGAAGLAAAAAPLAIVAAAGTLDPAVLGAVTIPGAGHSPGTQAAWFLLAHWDW